MSEPSIGEVVNRSARLFRRLADRRLAPLGLSAGYLPVITALIDAKTMSQKTLTESAGIEQPTMAATLARMERDGLVERQSNPADKRSARFRLTASTLERVPQIKVVIRDMNAEAVASLSALDLAMLRSALITISAAIEQAVEDRLS